MIKKCGCELDGARNDAMVGIYFARPRKIDVDPEINRYCGSTNAAGELKAIGL